MARIARMVQRMDVSKPLLLSGEHVSLRPLEHAHAEELLRAANSSRTTFDFTWVPSTLREMGDYIARAIGEQNRGESVPFVVLDQTLSIVGCTRYMEIERWQWRAPAPLPVPIGPDALEIGFTWYAEHVQRTCVNTETKLLLCTHAFEKWGVRRIKWKTDSRNLRSREAILRLGARFDGVLRAHRPSADGLVRDTAFYSMLREEWSEAKNRLVQRMKMAARVNAYISV